MKIISQKIITGFFRARDPSSHKGDHGHALVVAGSAGKMGAALICARACLRAGAGLLTANVPAAERGVLQTAIPEAMLQMRGDARGATKFSAVGIGPAIGIGAASKALLQKTLGDISLPFLLDADALTILSKNKSMWRRVPKNTVITPHAGEFDRMFGRHENEEGRTRAAVAIAGEKKIIIVLKGHHTLVTNGSQSFVNHTGNAGLAKGGSGDALSGVITSFLAQGYEPIRAAVLGVYLHGLAADLAREKESPESMLITDVIEYFGKAFQTINKK